MAIYVKKKDYFDFSGIDLDVELKKSNSDNPTKAVQIFIDKVENFCINYLKSKYFIQDGDFDVVAMKAGVLHQIDYIRINGDLSTYNPNGLSKLSHNAKMEFKIGGMMNTAHPRPTERSLWG